MEIKSYAYYELPKISGIEDMLKQRAENRRGQVAFTFRNKKEILSKTYDEVYREARMLGRFLQTKYTTRTHIAIIGENAYEWILAFLSTVISGHVAVPLDRDLPQADIAERIRFADVAAVFYSDTYRDLVENIENIDKFCTKQICDLYDPQPDALESTCSDNDPACIFFTSGSSGNAKGVVLTHGNLTAEIDLTCKLFQLRGSTLSVLPYHHAFGLIVGVFMAYNHGYNIFINKSIKQLAMDLTESKPHTLVLVPLFIETFYRQMMTNIQKSGNEKRFQRMTKLSNVLRHFGIDIRKKCFHKLTQNFGGNLEYIISGGAMLDPSYIKRFREIGIELLNGYGTTECSPCTAVNRPHYHQDGTVGVLIPGASAKIAEDGEVLLSGPHVMQGYYKDPSGTAEALQDGWYHTGDIGSIDQDGFITLTGRKKNLIILSNGENIAPEELETRIQHDPAVLEVLVYAHAGKLVAEIYPDESHRQDQAYFDKFIRTLNADQPICKQIASVRLRDQAFIKSSNQKIARYKNIPQE